MRQTYEVRTEDVGKKTIKMFGHQYLVANLWGRTYKKDVGKRVFLIGFTPMIENDEQFQARVGDLENDED